MKIHLESFVSNNPNITFDDVVKNLLIGKTAEGIVNLHFETADKYIEVDANGSSLSPAYEGKTIYLFPHLFDGNDYLDRSEDDFYEHPGFWMARLVVELDTLNYTPVVVPLKYRYFVSFIPDESVMNYECLGKATVIHYE